MLLWNLFWIVIGMLVVLTIMQFIYVWMYLRFLRRPERIAPEQRASSYPSEPAGFQPKTAVILCVRGEDPTLLECLTGLSLQSYTNFELHVVADAADDPALEIVGSFFDGFDADAKPPTIHIFEDHPKTRSLKCSALIHAISNLDDSCEVVALVDADVVADPNWLKDLISPLHQSEVGASTGNRWFAPNEKGIGSLVRQAWNAGALPQMTLYGIPWGGSLAIKRTTIEKCDLLNEWGNAFCEDTMLTDLLNGNDLSIERVPNLVVSNGETTQWRKTLEWITRQLVTVRLHHKNWPLVLAHGLSCGICFAGPVILAIAFLVQQRFLLASFSLVAFLIFQLINMGLITWIRGGNEKIIASRDVTSEGVRTSVGLTFLVSAVAQWTYVIAVVKAATCRTIRWRGVSYAIGKGKIEMLDYRPYADLDIRIGENASIE